MLFIIRECHHENANKLCKGKCLRAVCNCLHKALGQTTLKGFSEKLSVKNKLWSITHIPSAIGLEFIMLPCVAKSLAIIPKCSYTL